jgi:branched-subunit amino acid aminotransferase/4-amino-4-deoxychorismate lyase
MPAQEPISAQSRPSLIETLLWTRAEGYHLFDGHLARLASSAQALGYPRDDGRIRAALKSVQNSGDRLRVRLLLHHDGGIEISAQSIDALLEGTVWRAAVARIRLDPADRMLAHKTTRRQFYDDERVRLGREQGVDEALFLNLQGEVCEGSITTIFLARDGLLLTPPLQRGLLPGVLRAHLLHRGNAREAEISLCDLADGFYLGNSVRGLIAARLAGPV